MYFPAETDSNNLSVGAERIRRMRKRNKVIEKLMYDQTEEALWAAVIEFQGYKFRTFSGLVFSYSMKKGRGDTYTKELFIDRRENSKTAKPYVYHAEHYAAISAVRKREMKQMKELTTTSECYSQFVVRCLDDPAAAPCRKCANCLGRELLSSRIDKAKAAQYLNALVMEIEPRKQWALSSVTEQRKIRYVNRPGICLAKYGDAGYGDLVKRDKYSGCGKFCDELVGKSANVLGPMVKQNRITHICSVPSLRSGAVEDFARRLASRLGMEYVSLLEKSSARQQKEMENSAFQCANAFGSFRVIPGRDMPVRVLLVDDVVDSRWTLTVCGYRLMEAGCEEVYPFALADSSQKEM